MSLQDAQVLKVIMVVRVSIFGQAMSTLAARWCSSNRVGPSALSESVW